MRFLTSLLFIILIQSATAQNKVHFYVSKYETILNIANKENKPIFLMLYASWCPHCHKMINDVLSDKSVSDLLNSNFICVWQDTDTAEGKILSNKFNAPSLPSFVFLDSNGTVLYQLKGEYKTEDFISEIQNALNPKNQFPYLEKEFLSDPGNVQKCMNYIQILRKGKERADLSTIAHKYLATQSDSQLISEQNWIVISNGVTDIQSREFQYVLNHQKEFEKVVSPQRVDKKITSIVSELLKPFTVNLDTINYKKQRSIAKSIHTQKTDSLIFTYDLLIFERTKNWTAYKKITLENTEKQVWNNSTMLREIAQNYLNFVTDISSLEQAIKWNIRSLELNESLDGYLLGSKLYLKINNKKSAIDYARKAKKMCMVMGWNTNKNVNDLFLELQIK